MPPKHRLQKVPRVGKQIEYDEYGEEVDGYRVRAKGCRCAQPCFTFTCISSHHQGSRQAPWCRGSDDGLEVQALVGHPYRPGDPDIGWCDDCWYKTLKGFINKRIRDFKRSRKRGMSIKAYREKLWLRGTWLPERKTAHGVRNVKLGTERSR